MQAKECHIPLMQLNNFFVIKRLTEHGCPEPSLLENLGFSVNNLLSSSVSGKQLSLSDLHYFQCIFNPDKTF